MVETLVQFKHVQKSFDGESLVVKDLNLTIAKGEFLTVLGPSGSGKTTVLMMLAGFETPTHGSILLRDKPLNRLAPHKRDFGMVFQDYALFPHMSVGENLAFPLRVRGFAKSETTAKVDRALSMVRLDGMTDRRISRLSGGQRQRVALARALVFEPELVLMDEPLGALDKNLREEMQYELKHLHEQLGLTVVYVTHDQSEALTLSNRIAVLHDGLIQQIDDPATLYEQPINTFVATFIGECNTFVGELAQTPKTTDAGHPKCAVAIDQGRCRIGARAVNIPGLGGKTTLVVRPERVDFAQCAHADRIDTSIEGVIEELIYLGDHIRARLTLAGNDHFIVKTPNNRQLASLKVGQKAKVVWHSDDCRALDHPGADSLNLGVAENHNA